MIAIKEMAHLAIERGELDSLLRGEKSYELPHPEFSPTAVPQDWYRVIKEGIYPLAESNPALITADILEKVILKITNDTKGTYCALMILWIQLMHEQRGCAPFILNRATIVIHLSEKLKTSKTDFIKEKRWAGSINPDGLWGEILRICKIIEEDYGIIIYV